MFEAAVWITGAVMLWVPGFVLTSVRRRRAAGDLASAVAQSIAAGLCFWPILLLWITTVGLRVSETGARAILVALILAAAAVMIRKWGPPPRLGYALVVVGVIGILAVVTRVAHVGDLALPAWVDSVHHTAIIRTIVDAGQVPSTYDPLIPRGAAFYHWGFHSLVAWLSWILGATDGFDIARIVLHFGQLLNALAVIMMYRAGRLLFRSWRAGALAAAIAGLVSYFPAYYVSWGRYTHLAGLLVLLALGPALWRLSVRRSLGQLIITTILAAGLVLIHARIAFFALTFAVALGAWRSAGFQPAVARASRPRSRGGTPPRLPPRQRRYAFLARWSLAAVIAGLLVSPWLIQLSQMEQTAGIVKPAEIEWTTPADIRASHLWVPRNRELLSIATGGLTGILGWPRVSITNRILSAAFWVLLVVCTIRRRGRPPWQGLGLLASWLLLTALLLNLHYLGLPRLQFASNTAAVISLFIPLSLAAAGFISWVVASLVRRRYRRHAAAVLVVAIAVTGAAGLMDVVNPATVLAQPADLEALKWIRENIPADARFAVRARPWLGGSFVGADGGYWITVLTDRRSILPPALYMWASPRPVAEQINSRVRQFSRADNQSDAALRSWLADEQINYLYFGARAAEPQPARFEHVEFADLVYDRGGVKIFRVR